jgi:hypothetical protein
VTFDNVLCLSELPSGETDRNGECHIRRQPELCFAIRRGYMHVHSGVLTREEEQAEGAFAQDGWRHAQNIPAALGLRDGCRG